MVSLEQIVTHLAARRVELYPWQLEGLRWMLQCEQVPVPGGSGGGGGLLADDPGLGKTYTSLGLVVGDTLDPARCSSTTLVVVPTSIASQWVEAGEHLLGSGAVWFYYGPQRQLTVGPQHRLVVTTYGVLQRDQALLEATWDRVILDEIHYLKNYQSKTSQRARQLVGTHRWGLTGTPYQNSSEEVASLFRFVCDIRSNSAFVQVNTDLPRLVRDRMLRRTKAETARQSQGTIPLAGLTVETTEVDFRTEAERTIYQTVARNIATEYQRMLGTGKKCHLEALELLLRLRQCCQHPELGLQGLSQKFQVPALDRTRFGEVSSKMLALGELLGEHPDEPGLVFSPFRGELELLETYLAGLDYQVYRLDGSRSGPERQQLLQQVRETAHRHPTVLLVQSRAGGVGLNLQQFSRVYLMTPDWNPSADFQAIARAHRLGQTRHVYVKTLVIRDPCSVDRRILQVQQQKQDGMEQLLGERCGVQGRQAHRFTPEVWSQLLVGC